MAIIIKGAGKDLCMHMGDLVFLRCEIAKTVNKELGEKYLGTLSNPIISQNSGSMSDVKKVAEDLHIAGGVLKFLFTTEQHPTFTPDECKEIIDITGHCQSSMKFGFHDNQFTMRDFSDLLNSCIDAGKSMILY